MRMIAKHHLVAQMITSSARASASDRKARTESSPIRYRSARKRRLVGAIEGRRSGLSPGKVRSGELDILLRASTDPLPPTLEPELRLRLSVMALVRRVLDIESGIYRYDQDEHRLVACAGLEPQSDRPLMLQHDHEHAAAILVLVSPLSAWLDYAGDRGYRAAALAVGYVTDRLYLTAESQGLSYTASSGFSPRVMDRTLGLDGYQYTSFFTFVLGGPRP